MSRCSYLVLKIENRINMEQLQWNTYPNKIMSTYQANRQLKQNHGLYKDTSDPTHIYYALYYVSDMLWLYLTSMKTSIVKHGQHQMGQYVTRLCIQNSDLVKKLSEKLPYPLHMVGKPINLLLFYATKLAKRTVYQSTVHRDHENV